MHEIWPRISECDGWKPAAPVEQGPIPVVWPAARREAGAVHLGS